MAAEDQVLYQISDHIATITINRPDARNALNYDVMRSLLEAFGRAKDDDKARVVVLTGAGDKAFCAGGDLKGFQPDGLVKQHDARGFLPLLFETIEELGKPVVGRINGHALGGGFGLMLACDLVVAVDNVKMGTPEILVGLFPMMVMAQLFRNVGRKRGMEMILLGEKITGAEALEQGLINRAVSRENLDEGVGEITGKLTSLSPAVLKLGRDAFYHSQDMEMGPALRYLQTMLTVNLLTEDAAEGIAAFMQKRKPDWKGK